MKRRDFLKFSTLATFTSSASAGTLLAQNAPSKSKPFKSPWNPPAPPSALGEHTPPVLQNISETGVTVVWSVSGPATGWIEYGETEALGESASGAVDGLLPFDSRVLRVRLTGLKPGRKYFYRAHSAPVNFKGPYQIRRGEGIANSRHSFTTLNPEAKTTRFTVWNDTHQRKDTLAKLIEHLPDYPADFLFWNGDIFNDIATEEMLIAETLHPAGLPYATSLPMFVCRGNHDSRGAYGRMLARTVETPGGRYYYSFRQGPIAFLVLDTGEDKDDAHPEYGGLGDFASYRTEQQRWLEQTIAQPGFQSAPFRVLLTHIPLRGHAYSPDSCLKWEPLLANARIDFAFSGHTHNYAYNKPTEKQPFPLLVGGGPQLEKATFIYVQASAENLNVRMFGSDRRDLGHWEVQCRT